MDPVTVSVTVARPREEVFEYLADIANHAEFTDHFLKEWHLTRADSYGRGAGARFRIDAPVSRFGWGDMTLVEVEPPYRIVEKGRSGKFNRVRGISVYTLTPGAGESTKVELTVETQADLLSDRLLERVAGGAWWKRNNRKALHRLRSILEEGRDRGHRTTVAAR